MPLQNEERNVTRDDGADALEFSAIFSGFPDCVNFLRIGRRLAKS
jgi:hypothetical protein